MEIVSDLLYESYLNYSDCFSAVIEFRMSELGDSSGLLDHDV